MAKRSCAAYIPSTARESASMTDWRRLRAEVLILELAAAVVVGLSVGDSVVELVEEAGLGVDSLTEHHLHEVARASADRGSR